jgi:hypothetical protein
MHDLTDADYAARRKANRTARIAAGKRRRKKAAKQVKLDAAYRKAVGGKQGKPLPKVIGYSGRTGDLSKHIKRPRGTS